MSFPDHPFPSLPEGLQDNFWEISGTEHLAEAGLTEDAQWYYAIGFGYHAEDYESMGIDKELVTAAREDFFNLMGLEWENFDWDAWRDEMGYNEQ